MKDVMKTWRERIIDARIRGGFTKEENNLALSWVSCAVGEQRQILPQVVIVRKLYQECAPDCIHNCCNAPKDRWLQFWGDGAHFAGAVRYNNFGLAEKCLDKIEDRVLQMKRKAK